MLKSTALGLRASGARKRMFRMCTLAVLTTLTCACAMPPYVTRLDRVLDRQSLTSQAPYGYPCTFGAHRGASEDHMENTMTALLAAEADKRYAFIEFDVQYSLDKKIVVYHDKRMLRLFGSLKAIGQTSFAELSEITGGDIAAYDEAVGVLKKKLNIEIKSQGDALEDRSLADEIIADLRARKRDRDVLISSISSDVITYVKQRYPDIPTGQVFWLTSSTYLHFDGLTQKLYREMDETRADYLILYIANLRNIDDLLRFKPKGKTIVFWDFDDTMFIVHKDLSDRLWGHSGIRSFFQFFRYKLATWFERSGSET